MIDTHAHVHDPAFDADREAVLARAREAGVQTIVTVGTDLADSRRALALASLSQLAAAIGIHPHEAKDAPSDIAAAFDEILKEAEIRPVAIGEAGLDYHYMHSPAEDQRRVLALQLDFARERGFPIIYHQREAFDDFVAVLRAGKAGEVPGVVHCFTGDTQQARCFVDEFGLRLGIGGVLTFKTAEPLREAVRAVGLQHLVLETDCPYLAPIPHRGKRNEPAFVALTARRLAELFELPLEEVLATTDATARGLFAL
jgi:TatD DNase family protein